MLSCPVPDCRFCLDLSSTPTVRNVRLQFDHLLLSPRNEKIANNTYHQRPRRRIDEAAAAAAGAPLDFDRPHPRVLAALATEKKRRKEVNQVDSEHNAQPPLPLTPESDAASMEERDAVVADVDGRKTKQRKNSAVSKRSRPLIKGSAATTSVRRDDTSTPTVGGPAGAVSMVHRAVALMAAPATPEAEAAGSKRRTSHSPISV